MNALSWMLYIADVAGSLKGILYVGTAVACFVYGAYLLQGNYRAFVYDENDGIFKRAFATLPRAALILIAPFVAALIPSQSTVYAIAASELGETVVKSETGGKAAQALNAWLDRQIGAPSDSDRSGEATETRSGSAEGESAGRQASPK